MAFPFQNLLGYQLQVFGIWICIALHCACAPPLFVARLRCHVKQHLADSALKKSNSHRTSVLETKVTDFVSTMSRKIECNHLKLYCIYRCFNTQNYIYPF